MVSWQFIIIKFRKNYFLQFLTKTLMQQTYTYHMEINKCLVHIPQNLVLIIDHNLSWCTHIHQLYVIRFFKPLLSLESLRMVYFLAVHSIISYGIIFWASSTHTKIIFKIQKRLIRIITNSGNRDSWRDLFRELSILPLQSQYIFCLLMFVVKNKDFFKRNSVVHTFNTRSNHDLHLPVVNLTISQKWVWWY
jgi:hypothetical protein